MNILHIFQLWLVGGALQSASFWLLTLSAAVILGLIVWVVGIVYRWLQPNPAKQAEFWRKN